mmetsp:Transcript_799/g.2895  ORF Transcript_799/g.2895 Transcript_799/m.2895 type:complete len:285 (-) Transcript_799:649-1503(-)
MPLWPVAELTMNLSGIAVVASIVSRKRHDRPIRSRESLSTVSCAPITGTTLLAPYDDRSPSQSLNRPAFMKYPGARPLLSPLVAEASTYCSSLNLVGSVTVTSVPRITLRAFVSGCPSSGLSNPCEPNATVSTYAPFESYFARRTTKINDRMPGLTAETRYVPGCTTIPPAPSSAALAPHFEASPDVSGSYKIRSFQASAVLVPNPLPSHIAAASRNVHVRVASTSSSIPSDDDDDAHPPVPPTLRTERDACTARGSSKPVEGSGPQSPGALTCFQCCRRIFVS